MPTKDELISLAKAAAVAQGLDPALVCAICEQESGWDPYALRYESAFFSRYIAPVFAAGAISTTEAYARSFSWGLMQVMGQVAREHGFIEAMPLLCDPATALQVGCKVLAHKLAAGGGDVHAGLQLWNGGGNPNYADQVMARVAKYQDPSPLIDSSPTSS